MERSDYIIMLKEMDPDQVVDTLKVSTEDILSMFPEKLEAYINEREEEEPEFTFVEAQSDTPEFI